MEQIEWDFMDTMGKIMTECYSEGSVSYCGFTVCQLQVNKQMKVLLIWREGCQDALRDMQVTW